jgi:hypothetical protein
MEEVAQGRSNIDQPEPVHDYGLTVADSVIAASRLSDAEIDALFDASTANVVSESPTSMGRKFARAIEAAVLARQSVPDDFARDAARYRWLRDIGDSTWEPMAKRVGCVPGLIDMAIDAAIAAAAPLPPKEQP